MVIKRYAPSAWTIYGRDEVRTASSRNGLHISNVVLRIPHIVRVGTCVAAMCVGMESTG